MGESSTHEENQGHPTRFHDKVLLFIRDWWILIGGLSSAVWVFWRFLFDISVPVNIVVDLDSRVDELSPLKGGSLNPEIQKILPVKFSITAKNISGRKTLNIYNPVWVAYGTTLLSPREKWAEINDDMAVIAEREFGHPRRYQQLRKLRDLGQDSNFRVAVDATKRRLEDFAYSRSLIGVGTLFGNSELKPLEEIKSEQIIPVLRGKYDLIEVRVFIPTTDGDRRRGLFGLIGPKQEKDDINAYLFSRSIADGSDLARPPRMSMSFFRMRNGRPIDDYPMSKKELESVGAQIQTSASQLWVGSASLSSEIDKP